ncbi:MAG TPA: hypothetical protein VFH14_09210 [Gemmatimonadaceae bacterium]|nr:hypothetical protein [Gemmatimonadaceae bacterium]
MRSIRADDGSRRLGALSHLQAFLGEALDHRAVTLDLFASAREDGFK